MNRKGKIWFSTVYFLASQVTNFISSYLLHMFYPERPIVPDLLFDLVPQLLWLEYISEPLILGSIIVFFLYIFSSDRKNIPFYFTSLGSVYFIRAFLMILTPLGRPTGNGVPYGLFKFIGIIQHGMFPSGHVALSFIIYLIIPRDTHRGLKSAAVILCILQIAVLVFSRGHYSIDIAGGLLISWVVWSVHLVKKSN